MAKSAADATPGAGRFNGKVEPKYPPPPLSIRQLDNEVQGGAVIVLIFFARLLPSNDSCGK